MKIKADTFFPAAIPYRNIIFIAFFPAAYLVYHFFTKSVFPLAHFNGRSISLATAEGMDIGARVSYYYKAIFSFAAASLIFFYILSKLYSERTRDIITVANALSAAGCGLMYFQVTGTSLTPEFHFLFAALAVCAAGIFAGIFVDRVVINSPLSITWSLLMALSVFMFEKQMASFSGHHGISLPVITLVFGSAFFLIIILSHDHVARWINITLPFAWMPVISFLSMEIWMICNQRGYHSIHQQPVYYFLLALIILPVTSKIIRAGKTKDAAQIIFKRWIPVMIFGVACLAMYKPVVAIETDWFEDGNRLLPLHQLFHFGKIPFLDTFCSHAFQDFAPGLVYSFFNHANPEGVYVYKFLIDALVLVLTYNLIRAISGNGYVALFMTMVFPFAGLLVPTYFNFAPLGALVILRARNTPSYRNYRRLFFMIALMILWRIDLGISVLTAAVVTLIILNFTDRASALNYKKMFRGLLSSLMVFALLFAIALCMRGQHIFTSVSDALAYLSSFQSYGRTNLGAGDSTFRFLYFVLPVLVIAVLIFAAGNLYRNKFNRNESNAAVILIFLSVFYISNLQRGLVRHTLAKNGIPH